MAPAGFNPTLTNALVVKAVGWTAALRERLLALAGPRALVPGLPMLERAPQARGAAAGLLPEDAAEAAEGDWHDWAELARPWRMGPGGVAVSARAIATLSTREVVSQICGNLRRAAAELGAEADVERIAALEAAARALLGEPAEAGAAPPLPCTQEGAAADTEPATRQADASRLPGPDTG